MKVVSKNKKNSSNISKRVLLSASRKAVIAASHRAMSKVGYVIKVEDGWIVKETAKGKVKRLKKLSPRVKASEVILD